MLLTLFVWKQKETEGTPEVLILFFFLSKNLLLKVHGFPGIDCY